MGTDGAAGKITQVDDVPCRASETVSFTRLVGYNLARGRRYRGMTQTELGERLTEHTGTPWSRATVSAAEKSWDNQQRVRHFDADELAAFALVLDLPISYFFLPPPTGPTGNDVRKLAWLTCRKAGGPQHALTSHEVLFLLGEVSPEVVEDRLREDAVDDDDDDDDDDDGGNPLEAYGLGERDRLAFDRGLVALRVREAVRFANAALEVLERDDSQRRRAGHGGASAGAAVAAGQAGPGHPVVTGTEQYDEGER